MENIQDFIYTNIPPSVLSRLSTHTSAYYQIYAYILQARTFVMATLNKTLNPLLTKLLHEPDIASFLLLLVILYISMKVLDYLWQTALFWAKLMLRLLLFMAVGAVVVWAWNRGAEGVVRDVKWVAAVWRSEYDGWKRRSDMAKVRSQAGQGMGARWMQRDRWR